MRIPKRGLGLAAALAMVLGLGVGAACADHGVLGGKGDRSDLFFGNASWPIALVPDPSSLALLGLGLGSAAALRWRQRLRRPCEN